MVLTATRFTMRALRAISAGFGATSAIGACVFTSPAQADWSDGYHHWHPRDGWYRAWGASAVVVAPQPFYHALPAAHYVPPAVTYVPSPVYDAPRVSFGFAVR